MLLRPKSLKPTLLPRERLMSSIHASTNARAAAAILLTTLCTGCVRPLAMQHEFFSPLGGSAGGIGTQTQHAVSHHRALQVARHACRTQAAAPAPLEETNVPADPNPAVAAAREALAELCATPARPAVAAHGGAWNAYRRWVEDQVHELPAAGETAAAAGGS